MNRHRILDPEAMLQFVTGGQSIFTLANSTTGNRYTYKVSKKKHGDIFWVSLLNGSDNVKDYRFFGTLFPTYYLSNTYRFKHSRNGKIGHEAQSVVAWSWFLTRLQSGKGFPEGFQFWHEGRCGRCGRRLTVPSSLSVGFGPECEKKVA